ncbi:hypothetical protein FTW19_09195 [Terriglobus albidus]|uniref:Uncharacterized protein n=1 Tax=Terriglobus albidus TaxID=1592106 RepID=A0A5B9E949_9BACT|nr:hypothetical protein [Terriglobus albidus]QEE28154.1 hypothetical protein FTW19_09195 [Terriglobus albidus]
MPSTQDIESIHMRDWRWSQAEKIAARRAFEQALHQDLDTVMRTAKERIAQITKPAELWDIEDWLGDQRRRIDRDYDYRYSVLPIVFAGMIRSGRLTENDLHGIDPAKLDIIRRIASY